MDETNPTPWGAMMGASNDAGGNEPDCEPAEPSGDATSADIEGPSPVLQQQITPDMVAAGYQPGMATQNITIGDEGNGPKVPMIIAAVLVVIATSRAPAGLPGKLVPPRSIMERGLRHFWDVLQLRREPMDHDLQEPSKHRTARL